MELEHIKNEIEKNIYYTLKVRKRNTNIFTTKSRAEVECDLWDLSYAQIITAPLTLHPNQKPPTSEEAANLKENDYWGWFDTVEKKLTLIYPSHILLTVCFPYGISEPEKDGSGKAVRLIISQVR